MKNFIPALGLSLMLFISSASFAQSEKAFEKNDIIINGGFGIGFGYSYQNYGTEDFYNNYYGDYSYNFRVHYSVAGIFPVTAEYAIGNKFGLGLAYQHGSYINSNSHKSSNNNFGVFGAFHFMSRRKVELYTRVILGYSFLEYKESPDDGTYSSYYDPADSYVPTTNNAFTFKAKGAYGKPSFGMRLYFSEHIGMFADIGVGIYSYRTSQVDSDRGTYDLNKSFHYVLINGELTTGLAVKF